MMIPSQFQLDKRQEADRHKNVGQPLFSPALLPAAVLFDWDNTLVDTWKTIFYAVNNTLLAFGREPWTEDIARTHIQHSGREAFPKLFGDKAREAQNFFYRLIEEDKLQGLNPMPEAEALLKVLVGKGIPTGVVSNKRSSFLHKEVAHLQWKSYFGVLVGAGDAARDKPAADPILLALQNLNVPVSRQVWMIGDAPVDWDCAIAAGCQPIAIGAQFEYSFSEQIVSIENCGALKKIFAEM